MLHLWDSSISSSVWLCMNIQTFCHCCSIAKLCPSLWDPMDLQHARLLCLSPSSGACSNSCLLSWWCHPTISSSVLFSSCLQSFPASGSFPRSQFFASGGQSIGVSASASVLPMNTQDWSPFGLTGLISLQSKGLSRVFSNTTVKSMSFSALRFMAQLSHPYMTTGKTIALTRRTFVGKVCIRVQYLGRDWKFNISSMLQS